MSATAPAWELIVSHLLSVTVCSLAGLALVRATRTRAGVGYGIWVATSIGFLIPIIVNTTFAQRAFGSTNAVGRRVRQATSDREPVGPWLGCAA